MTYAVSFDPLDGGGEEHHHATLEQAQQHYAKLHDRRRAGALTLWAWQQHSETWEFVQGHVQLFEGKPSSIAMPSPPPHATQPMHPAALEELSSARSDGSHHFAPDH